MNTQSDVTKVSLRLSHNVCSGEVRYRNIFSTSSSSCHILVLFHPVFAFIQNLSDLIVLCSASVLCVCVCRVASQEPDVEGLCRCL